MSALNHFVEQTFLLPYDGGDVHDDCHFVQCESDLYPNVNDHSLIVLVDCRDCLTVHHICPDGVRFPPIIIVALAQIDCDHQ